MEPNLADEMLPNFIDINDLNKWAPLGRIHQSHVPIFRCVTAKFHWLNDLNKWAPLGRIHQSHVPIFRCVIC